MLYRFAERERQRDWPNRGICENERDGTGEERLADKWEYF